MRDERGELITVTEAAAVLGCGRWAITKILRRHLDDATGLSRGGRIEGTRIAGLGWLVCRDTVQAAAAAGMSWAAGRRRGEKKPGGTKRRRAS